VGLIKGEVARRLPDFRKARSAGDSARMRDVVGSTGDNGGSARSTRDFFPGFSFCSMGSLDREAAIMLSNKKP